MSTLFLETPGKAAGKYLTFVLGTLAYGIPILKVREIIQMVDITPIPRMPAYMRGVINLRGKIVPVMDLRVKFNLPDTTTSNRTCIIVSQVVVASVTKLVGLIVDAIEEVDQVAEEDIEPAPDFGKGAPNHYIRHMAKVHGQLKALLDIDQLVQEDPSLLPAPTTRQS